MRNHPFVLRTIFSLGFFQVIGIVITTVRAKVFAVLLGPAGFGVVATIDQLVTSAAQLSNLGLPFTALKFLSRGHSLGEEQFRKTYAAFLKAITALAILALLAAIFILPALLTRLDPQLVNYRKPVVIALFGIPSAMLLIFFVNVLAARQLSVQSILLTTISSAGLLAFGTIGCWLGGIEGVYWATVPTAAALTVGMIGYAQVKLKLPAHDRSVNFLAALKGHTAAGEIAAFTYVAVSCFSVQLLVARYVSITQLGEEAAGLLQAGLSVALSIGAVLGPANSVYLTPYLNRDVPVEKKVGAANSFLPRLVLLYYLGALPIMLFPDFVLRMPFSSRFSGAVAVLPWFVVWQCLGQIASVYQQLLIGLDDVRVACIITSLGHVLAVALSFCLIGPLGLLGIAVAFIASALFIVCVAAVRLHAKYRLAVSKSTPVLVGFAALGLLGVAMLARTTAEMTLAGVGVRSLIALVFSAGLWVALPISLRSELFAALAARLSAIGRGPA